LDVGTVRAGHAMDEVALALCRGGASWGAWVRFVRPRRGASPARQSSVHVICDDPVRAISHLPSPHPTSPPRTQLHIPNSTDPTPHTQLHGPNSTDLTPRSHQSRNARSNALCERHLRRRGCARHTIDAVYHMRRAAAAHVTVASVVSSPVHLRMLVLVVSRAARHVRAASAAAGQSRGNNNHHPHHAACTCTCSHRACNRADAMIIALAQNVEGSRRS